MLSPNPFKKKGKRMKKKLVDLTAMILVGIVLFLFIKHDGKMDNETALLWTIMCYVVPMIIGLVVLPFITRIIMKIFKNDGFKCRTSLAKLSVFRDCFKVHVNTKN